MLRVIAGKYRGKKLISSVNNDIRPTKSLVREALFNILHAKMGSFNGLNIADICCGSGAIGIESLSRGANFVSFVDNCAEHLKIIAANLKTIEGNYKVINSDILNLSAADMSYDIIFLDPPYNVDQQNIVFTNLVAKNWLTSKTLLIYEAGNDKELALDDSLTLVEERKYGKSKLFFIKLKSKN
jgi:16S rRNA (guanine966-N2)-methyltransferase